MGLRLSEGVDLKALTARTGYSIAASEMALLEEEGLIMLEGQRARVTRRGRLVLNAIVKAAVSRLERAN